MTEIIKDNNKIVEEHIQKQNIHTVMVIPSHPDRIESPEFIEAKKTLKKDGNHEECWLCGSKNNLQVHHFFAEYCEGQIINLISY